MGDYVTLLAPEVGLGTRALGLRTQLMGPFAKGPVGQNFFWGDFKIGLWTTVATLGGVGGQLS